MAVADPEFPRGHRSQRRWTGSGNVITFSSKFNDTNLKLNVFQPISSTGIRESILSDLFTLHENIFDKHVKSKIGSGKCPFSDETF